ncbi:MAG: hypothetical protein ACXAEU_25765 [Candidatus Hodarchaeales archaeon]|jgi:hypothetical protein
MQEGLGGSIAIFFKLPFPLDKLQFILEKENFEIIKLKPPIQYPSIVATPVKITIAKKHHIHVRYNPERYLLDIVGPLENLIIVLEEIIIAFTNNGYDIEDMTRYLEFNTRIEENIETSVVSVFEKQINLGTLKKIRELLSEEDIRVFQINLSNSISPLHDNWLSLRINPDIHSSKIIIIEITKRTETSNEMKSFITSIDTNFDEILKIFSGADS